LARWMLRRLKDRPQILYTLTVVPNIWGRLFGKLARVPVIVSSWRDLYPKQYESWMWPLSRRIITNSPRLKELMVPRYGVDPARVSVVPNGVDADWFSPDRTYKTEEPSILFAGRLEKEKDPVNLLEAFRITIRHHPQTRLDFLGNGRLRHALQNWVHRRHLEGKVRLLPGTTDIRPMLRSAWVLAMPSLREASPNVILEAMSCELPVVGTGVGGIPELVRDGETGFVVEPGNPQALAAALCRLLGNDSLRKVMGRRAREQVLANHTIAGMVSETERLLFEAAAQWRRRDVPCDR